MSTGRSITCDQCGTIQPYSSEDHNNCAIPEGWIRITARNPRRYGWGDSTFADFEDAGDFCSMSCSTTWIYKINFDE